VFLVSLNPQIKFLVNCDPAMSPRTENGGVVDFGEEEVRVQPRDTSKREIFGVPKVRNFASRIFDAQIASWDN
jgi:hypothetical protein